MKKIGKVCGALALLAPFWQMLIRQLYLLMQFSSRMYILLCVSNVILCILALIISIIIEVKNFREEEQVLKRNRLLICGAIVLGLIIFSIIFFIV
jgi:hypothetical protein